MCWSRFLVGFQLCRRSASWMSLVIMSQAVILTCIYSKVLWNKLPTSLLPDYVCQTGIYILGFLQPSVDKKGVVSRPNQFVPFHHIQKGHSCHLLDTQMKICWFCFGHPAFYAVRLRLRARHKSLRMRIRKSDFTTLYLSIQTVLFQLCLHFQSLTLHIQPFSCLLPLLLSLACLDLCEIYDLQKKRGTMSVQWDLSIVVTL